MWRSRFLFAFACSTLTLASACDKATSPKPAVTVHARFLNGATPSGSASPALAPSHAALFAAAVPANGLWVLSPDLVTMRLTHVALMGDSVSGANVDCEMTFDKSRPSLTQLNDCQFSVTAGSFKAFDLTFRSSFKVLINDTVNGFYSTATGIVTSPPVGGAQLLTITPADTVSYDTGPTRLPSALVLTDTAGTPATVSVVINGLQSFYAEVNNGAVAVGWPSHNVAAHRPALIGAVGSVAAVEYYVAQALGSAGSYCAGGGPGLCPPPVTGISAVGVYYRGPTTPAIMGLTLNGSPSGCSLGGSGSYVNDPRGYQGLDAAGNLGWALAADTTWKNYTTEMRMARLTTVGMTTTLYCQNRSTDPAPAGGSYASGAPNIATAANSLGTYVLVAK